MLHRTITKKIQVVGRCPFNGKIANVSIYPSTSNTGIRFIRDDLIKEIGDNCIIVSNKNADFECQHLNTTISNDYCKVLMVEHILSSLWAFKITDIDIHVDCDEIPMLDGSSNFWIKAFKSAGITEFGNDNVEPITIKNELKYEEGDKYILVKPCDRLKITYTIDFPDAKIGRNTFIYDENINSYEKDISLARTFCTKDQVKNHIAIKKYFNNYDMVVYDDENFSINNGKGKLRYTNEATRHKILDLIGDLMSTGKLFQCEFICYKSGHAMNRKIIDLIYDELKK